MSIDKDNAQEPDDGAKEAPKTSSNPFSNPVFRKIGPENSDLSEAKLEAAIARMRNGGDLGGEKVKPRKPKR
jgi:hypothetical protein